MPSLNLFPHEDDLLIPAPDRRDPVLWLRRLVIVPSLINGVMPIREIEFRRGLNIIQTRLPEAGSNEVVGHSVGKTLLTRLIRYSLGEDQFAMKKDRDRIGVRLPTGNVICVWMVAGREWCVVRPLQPGRDAKSFALPVDDWRSALDPAIDHVPFSDFVACVEHACLSSLPPMTFPSGRAAKWRHVLAFLARDYECGYRQFHEWRHPDSESGTFVERNEASLLLRWLMGLIDPTELPLRDCHKALLEERQKTITSRRTQERFIDQVTPMLQTKFDLDVEISEGLFADQFVTKVESEIAKLQSLLDDRLLISRLQQLDADEDQATELLTRTNQVQAKIEAKVELLDAQLATRERAKLVNPYASESPFENCELAAACPMKLRNRPNPLGDPAASELTEVLRDEIDALKRDLVRASQHCEQQRAAVTEAKRSVRQERTRVAKETAGIERAMGRWEEHSLDAKRHRVALQKVATYGDDLKNMDARIDDSRKVQEAMRDEQYRVNQRLSRCYDQVLRQVFGATAGGKIEVDAIGLKPAVDDRLSPSGAAVATMASVLAFDLACLTGSITGVGHHPRFHIHDSPRGGDMEEPLFHRLFELAHRLEGLTPGSEPSFQYIVTTTTPPPKEFGDEEGPFVCETLDARSDEGRLLRMKY